MKKLGIYLHIPFCVQKCLYCDFCSFPRVEGELISRYANTLCRDIKIFGERCGEYTVDTVYFGGGTPTLLPIKEFEKIMKALARSFKLDDSAEISCECNPATADREYFHALRDIGLNRLSIGLQSANENELRALGRVHSYKEFTETFDSARVAGFDNISADLMYGIPEQTLISFEHTLSELVKLSPEHISAYGLKIEEGTPFGKMVGSLALPDEDTEYEMYEFCTNYLRDNGYYKYEISNFSKRGYESRHNRKYWLGDDYLGLGVSAHSFFEGERRANSRDIKGYIWGTDITEEKRSIPPDERMAEYVMLHMRLAEGVDHREFEEKFGVDFDSLYRGKLDTYIASGHVIHADGKTSFSDKGFFVSNFILSDILEF